MILNMKIKNRYRCWSVDHSEYATELDKIAYRLYIDEHDPEYIDDAALFNWELLNYFKTAHYDKAKIILRQKKIKKLTSNISGV